MKVLFVCRMNVGRSQMAETFFNNLTKKHHATCAGTEVFEKEGQPLHPHIVDAMKEMGFDVSNNKRKQLTEKMVDEADRVVVIGKDVPIPEFLHGPKVITWDVPDPKGLPYDSHIKARDAIKPLVEKLVKKIG